MNSFESIPLGTEVPPPKEKINKEKEEEKEGKEGKEGKEEEEERAEGKDGRDEKKEENQEGNKEETEEKEEENQQEKKEEKKTEKVESKEEKELHEYLEKVVFKDLELTPEDEEKELARIKKEIQEKPDKVPAVMEEVTKKSFEKTRKYLKELFQEYVYGNIADADIYKRTRNKILDEEAEKWNKLIDEGIRGINPVNTEAQHNNKSRTGSEKPNKYDQLLKEKAKDIIRWIKEDAEMDSKSLEEESQKYKCTLSYSKSPNDPKYNIPFGSWGNFVQNIIDKRAREECPRVKIPKEDILDFLKQDIAFNGTFARVSININPKDLMFWIEHGRKIPSSEALKDPEIMAELSKLIDYNNPTPSQKHLSDQENIKRREKLEKKYVFNKRYPVYGALAMNRKEWRRGAAEYYGDIAVSLKNDQIKDRVAFTSWDSVDSGEIADFTYEHAIIIRAISDYLLEKASNYLDLSQDGFNPVPWIHSLFQTYTVHYIEAQILGGVTNDDISKIRVPSANDYDEKIRMEKFIKAMKDKYPKIAEEKLITRDFNNN